MNNDKQPIRPTLKGMAPGTVVVFPIERYESVATTVTRLNMTIPNARWSASIIKDNPDNDTPVAVKVTRIK